MTGQTISQDLESVYRDLDRCLREIGDGQWQLATGCSAPALGQHTDEILRGLGMAQQIEALRGAGIVH